MKRKEKIQADKVGRTWRTLNEYYKHLNLEQLEYLLGAEKKRKTPRRSFLLRLHQRISSLKTAAERENLLGD